MKMSLKDTSSSNNSSSVMSSGNQRCPLDDRVMDGLKEELDIFDKLRDACLTEDFNDPIWRHQINVEDVPADVRRRVDYSLLPTLADLQAESNALDEEIKLLEDEEDEIEPFAEPEGLWMTPEDLKTSTSSLVAQAKEAEAQINLLKTSLDGLRVSQSNAFDPLKVPDQTAQSLAAAGSVLKKLDELEKAMKKLPLDDRK